MVDLSLDRQGKLYIGKFCGRTDPGLIWEVTSEYHRILIPAEKVILLRDFDMECSWKASVMQEYNFFMASSTNILISVRTCVNLYVYFHTCERIQDLVWIYQVLEHTKHFTPYLWTTLVAPYNAFQCTHSTIWHFDTSSEEYCQFIPILIA